jgi:hypothetical protein
MCLLHFRSPAVNNLTFFLNVYNLVNKQGISRDLKRYKY